MERKQEERAGMPTGDSLREYGRGVAGGLIFSLPLLYTMEVWWAGFVSSPLRLVCYVIATFILLLGYNRFAGLREDASFKEVVIDSVEEMGIGLVISAVVLYLLGQISHDMHLSEILGKVTIEAMTVAIGVSVGTAQLGDEGGRRGVKGEDKVDFFGELVIAMCGAVLIAANVAPTEEILMIALETTALKLLGIVALSLFITYLILHYGNFRGARKMSEQTFLSHGLFSTFVSYAIALAASAGLLWFFGRFDDVSAAIAVSMIVVLAFAGSLGASAGRLLLKG